MHKTLLATAALLALPLTAAAQSTPALTIYGKVDVGQRRAIGEDKFQTATGSDSRVGFKGTHDLGDGYQAFFGFEHRFFPDTGATDGVMWKGVAQVGVQGAFGKLGMGRQYIPAFSLVQNVIDPFGGDTVAAVRDAGLRLGIAKVRVDGSVRYDGTFGGLSVALSTADAAKASTAADASRPFSAAVQWKSGPLLLAAGVEDPADAKDELSTVGAVYNFGVAKVSAGYSTGTTKDDLSVKGYVLGLAVPMGKGEIKAAYGNQKKEGVTTVAKLGLGYHHAWSKQLTVYTDVGNDSKAAAHKTGFDLGLKYEF
ncbi:porin [Ideonella livida]|uniref:Porin n=1 Tax=Ideonella livida TaxID=2707176 RepID=A0A7C9TGZ4_9BURK|nr:porin [Ideonella livida]NDY90018.1 porin [Ideonella livida]